MENSSNIDDEGEVRNEAASTSEYRLFDRHVSVHQFMGGGKAADVLLWKRRHVSFGIIIVATVAWITFERSGLPFLTICSDVLLVVIVMLFVRANFATYRNKQPKSLPELVLSEEMVNSVAASFRVKMNNMLLMAHDITLGKDFRLFFKAILYYGSHLVMCPGLHMHKNMLSFVCGSSLLLVATILSPRLPTLE